jgi:hypothetical protein
MGDLDTDQASLLGDGSSAPARFLNELESTPMTRSYKMLVLLAMLNEDRLPGSIDGADLAQAVSRLAQRSSQLQADIGTSLTDPHALLRQLEDNPIAAWCGGAGTGGTAYFGYDSRQFASRFEVPRDRRPAFQVLVRELVEWRLAEYLARTPDEKLADQRIVCKVSHAGGRPMLFLPDRHPSAFIPSGTVRVVANGETYEADFAKVAVNVVRKAESDRNELPGLLRGWFGPDAGLPGTGFTVAFEQKEDAWHLSPVHARPRPATDPNRGASTPESGSQNSSA